jgi:ABC-type transporter Mla MlaB component
MAVTLTPPAAKGKYHVARFGFWNIVGLVDAMHLQKTVKRFLRQGLDTLIVNMRGARDVDKAGWDCLVSTARRLQRSGGRVILRHCPDNLYTEIQTHHWDRLFLVPDRRADDAASLPAELRADDGEDEQNP